MKLYYVVKFIVSNTVAVAPINWVNEGVCKWPKYKSERFKRAVKNCEEPSNDWQDFDVQTMCLPGKLSTKYLIASYFYLITLKCAQILQSQIKILYFVA